MAVPGNVYSERSAGPNNLLRSGAIIVTDVVDILSALNFETGIVASTPVRAANTSEAAILKLIASEVSSSQSLINESGYSAAEFANIVSLMEITGKVVSSGAGHWVIRGKLDKT